MGQQAIGRRSTSSTLVTCVTLVGGRCARGGHRMGRQTMGGVCALHQDLGSRVTSAIGGTV